MTDRAHVLLSGGIDSTACVDHYRAAGREVGGIFVDYGQAAARAEAAAAGRIAAHFGIGLRTLTLGSARPSGTGLILGRNGFLIFAALLDVGAAGGTIALGVHAGTDYFDCSAAFIEAMRQMVGACSGGAADLEVPFANWFKHQIFDYARQRKLPLHLTYSCEAGTDPPCGSCLSCHDIRIDQLTRQQAAKAAPAQPGGL